MLRSLFLAHLDTWHSSFGYTRDLHTLAHALGATLEQSDERSLYLDWSPPMLIIQVLEEGRVIVPRLLFRAYHEIAHCLFLRAQGGVFKQMLLDRFPRPGQASGLHQALERLCNWGAAQLLMPQLYVDAALRAEGFTPRAVLALSSVTGASWDAALHRLISQVPVEVWAVTARATRQSEGGLWVGRWQVSRHSGPGARYYGVRGDLMPDNHVLFLDGAEELQEIALEVDGPWTDARPCVIATKGNQRFRRVCLFVFPDWDTQAAQDKPPITLEDMLH